MDIQKIYGRRLKANKDVTIFFGFPGSGSTKTLIAGKPSAKINSYLPSGYYELEPLMPGGKNQYVKDVAAVKVVEPDEPDDSSVFNAIGTAFSDYFTNSKVTIEKNAGFLGDGITDTVKKFKDGSLLFGGELKKLILAGVALILLIIIYKIYKL